MCTWICDILLIFNLFTDCFGYIMQLTVTAHFPFMLLVNQKEPIKSSEAEASYHCHACDQITAKFQNLQCFFNRVELYMFMVNDKIVGIDYIAR